MRVHVGQLTVCVVRLRAAGERFTFPGMTDQATIHEFPDLRRTSVPIGTPACSDDTGAALEAQATLLDDQAEQLQTQITSLRVQAQRLREIAQQVREQGVAAVGRVKPSPGLNLQAAIRDALRDGPRGQMELVKELGVSKATLDGVVMLLVDDGKLIRMPIGRGYRLAWLLPDEGAPQPREAPSSEPRIRADLAPRRGGPVFTERQNGASRRKQSTAGQGHRERQRKKRREAMTETAKQRQEDNKRRAEAAKARHRTHGKGATK